MALPTIANGARTTGAPGIARWSTPLTWLGLGLLGAALGVSQIIGGAYSEGTWAPLALGALALALALAVGLPRRLPMVPLAALLGLWLWSLLSSSWSDSSDAAYTAASRWLLYAATLAVLWWALAEDRRRAAVLLTGVAAGVLGVGAWMLAQMLSDQGATLFLGTRLNDPLGYINGQAGYLLAGVWPCLAVAEGHGTRNAILAGTGVAGGVILVALGLLTQSRSWGIALVATAILLLAAVPGRRRRAAAMLLVGGTMAVLYAPLADVWRHPARPAGVPTSATTHHAAVEILVAALVAAVLWGVAVAALERLAPSGSRGRSNIGRVASAVLAAIAVLVLVGIAINGDSITHRIKSQYNAFVKLAPAGGGTRFLSGAGDRYDYWRVAVLEFRSEPLHGVGAGNYQPDYYRQRRTSEEIQQPHSIELQTLAELGLVGALLLAVFLAAVAVGFVRTGRAAVDDPAARAVAVAAGGIFAGWLIQTSVDWMHLIPGLTAIALAAAAALLIRSGKRAPSLAGRGRVITAALATAIVCAGALTIAPRVLSLQAQSSAQRALAEKKPRVAIADATRALDYDPNSVGALVLRAAGFARLHAFGPTVADIKRAIALEPHNWVTWALLGDLLTRRGERRGARSAYERAAALNPREASVQIALTAPPRR